MTFAFLTFDSFHFRLSIMELTQIALIAAAKKMDIKVDLLEGCATDNILFSKGDKSILFCPDGVPLDNLSYEAFEIAANKQL